MTEIDKKKVVDEIGEKLEKWKRYLITLEHGDYIDSTCIDLTPKEIIVDNK